MTTLHRLDPAAALRDFAPAAEDVREAVLAGLSASPRTLPSRLFYDQAGSALFEQICDLPSYYLTRTELAILKAHLPAMADRIGPDALIIELGSGAGTKTRLLLDALDAPAGYVPIEISREALLASARGLCRSFPDLPILPVCADYGQSFTLPTPAAAPGSPGSPGSPGQGPARRVVYFPGSTIGNLDAPAARALFRRMRELAADGGGLLLGVDLVKSPDVLIPAYDDPEGVTAAFNLNLLRRINREAGADFDLSRWRHEARWNAAESRMESHLVSTGDQTVHVGGRRFAFAPGEGIWTESSYKYTRESIAALAEGFEPVESWTDPRGWFDVTYFRAI